MEEGYDALCLAKCQFFNICEVHLGCFWMEICDCNQLSSVLISVFSCSYSEFSLNYMTYDFICSCRGLRELLQSFIMHMIHAVFSCEVGRTFKQEVSMKVCIKKQVSKCPNVCCSPVSRVAWLLLGLIVYEVKQQTSRSQASFLTSFGFSLSGLTWPPVSWTCQMRMVVLW